MRLAVLLIAVSAVAAPAGSAGSPLTSRDCTVALVALSAEEDAVIARRGAGTPHGAIQRARLQQRQRAAALPCLGAADAPRAEPALRPPVSVPGITITPRAPSPRAANVAPLPAAVPQRPLVSITSCDALGCWASDGSRLQRQGAGLLGPRGWCTPVGAVLDCP